MVKEKEQIDIWDKTKLWPIIINNVEKAACLTVKEKEQLANSLAAEVIAATAYISRCTDPDRVAIAHLTTFIGAMRCPEVFSHREGESLTDRLLTGNYYPGGNPEAVKACMLILELISLNDHKKDFQEDLINGKVNPLTTDLNYDIEKEKIEREYSKLSSFLHIIYKPFYKKTIIEVGTWW